MKRYLESLFQAIFDHPAIGASINDHENRFLRVNKKFTELLGYHESEMLGKTPMDFTLTTDVDRTRSFHKNLTENTEETNNGEYTKRYIKKDGSILWAKVIAKKVLNPTNEKETLTLALIEDITPIMADKAQAEFDQLQLRMILDTSHLGIWCVDTNWKITFSNESLQKMLGYTHDQILNLSLHEITHPEDLKETNTKFGPTKPGQSYEAIRRYLKADGQYLWTKLTVSKFPDNDKKLYGLAIVEDITSQKQTEALIQQQQIKIISSAKMAALGEMAGGVAHEINNPLAIIIGKIAQISRKLETENFKKLEIQNDLKKVQMTAERIAAIVRGLRVFSRDADKDPWMSVELSSIINDTAALCNERFKAQGVQIKVQIPEGLSLSCRPTQVEQLMLNLFSNSIDAISHLNEKWISVDAFKNGDSIVISVTDSGHGIHPDIAGKIMQPFFTTKDVGRGTGLGLSISMGIAQQHRGNLSLDLKCPNTRFIITLPIVQSSLA